MEAKDDSSIARREVADGETIGVKINRKDLLTRSVSDSQAISKQQRRAQRLQRQPMLNTSFDDNDMEFGNTKSIAMLTSSSSMPNLLDLNAGIVPDVAEWGEFELPFESLTTDSLDACPPKTLPPAVPPSGVNKQKPPTPARQKPNLKMNLANPGIADKIHFFRQLSPAYRPNGAPDSKGTEQNKINIFKSDSTTGSAGGAGGSSSSSASVDTKDSMKALAKHITPVYRDGVEFAPLDIILTENLHMNTSGSGSASLSMSVDDPHFNDPSIMQSTDSRRYDPPESFSVSSWSQHSISVDVFSPDRGIKPKAQSDKFSREGILMASRQNSEQSITEKMLDDDVWEAGDFDLDDLGPLSDDPLEGTTHTRNHKEKKKNNISSHKPKTTIKKKSSNKPAAAANTTNQAKITGSVRKLSDSDIDVGSNERVAAIPVDGSAALLQQQQQAQPKPQFSFPTSYPAPLSRSNSGAGSGKKSPGSTSSGDTSLPPVYDPTTGIVYYPILPAGGTIPAVAGPMAIPANLLPLPVPGRSPTSPDETEDGGSTPMCGLSAFNSLKVKVGGFDVGSSPNSGNTSNNPTPKTTIRKDKNRGSYRCGRCGKPKVNHICAFVDATKINQAVQATGPVINPLSLQPFPGEKVLTVNPHRRSIQNTDVDSLHNLGLASHSDSFRLAGENIASHSDSFRLAGIKIVSHSDSFRRQNSGGANDLDRLASHSDSFRLVSRSNSSIAPEASTAARPSLGSAPDREVSRANSGGPITTVSKSLSGEDGSGTPGSNASPRPSVAFSDPISQQQIAQNTLAAESSEDAFFPSEYPPSSGNLVFSSRNSSVNSTYGNESDTSSTAGGEGGQQRSTISGMLNVDLGLSRFFRF